MQVVTLGARVPLKELVCNGSLLAQYLSADAGDQAMDDLQRRLCELPADTLQQAERLFLSQLDFTKFITVLTRSSNAMLWCSGLQTLSYGPPFGHHFDEIKPLRQNIFLLFDKILSTIPCCIEGVPEITGQR